MENQTDYTDFCDIMETQAMDFLQKLTTTRLAFVDKLVDTYKTLADVPDNIDRVYRTDTIFGTCYGGIEFAHIAIDNDVPVTIYSRHHARGWEQV